MFKKKFLLCLALTGCVVIHAQVARERNLQTGDFLFQNLDCGEMCDAIEAVTVGWHKMSFSHIGIVEKINRKLYVWESMGTGVRKVSFYTFKQRSQHPMICNSLYLI